MEAFDHSAVSPAPPEQVWKLLYDPGRFPQWWAGVGSVQAVAEGGDYTMYPEGYPDFPLPQALHSSREHGTVKISCLVSDLTFDWRLRPDGTGTDLGARPDPRPRGAPAGDPARHHPPLRAQAGRTRRH